MSVADVIAWRLDASLAALALSALLGTASAQTTEPQPPAGPGLRAGNIRSSGQTVPNPETLSQAPHSAIDRPLPDARGKTDYGICKGC